MLEDAALERELDAMTDAFTDVIATRVADLCSTRPWLFVNGLSRLVVDPERFPDEREEMNAVGMGAVYTHTSVGDLLHEDAADEIPGLVDRFFTPYAAAFTGLVDARLAARGEVTIIDLHSFPLDKLPYELHDGPRPEICLGTDAFHTPGHLVEAAAEAFAGFVVGRDSPFSGCYVPLKHHGVDDRVSALMVEMRRDLYMDDSFQMVDHAIGPLASALATSSTASTCGQSTSEPAAACTSPTTGRKSDDHTHLVPRRRQRRQRSRGRPAGPPRAHRARHRGERRGRSTTSPTSSRSSTRSTEPELPRSAS